MSDTPSTTLTWTDWRGRKQVRPISHTVTDIRKFEGTAVYPYLFMAANPNLSYSDMVYWLKIVGCERSQNWLFRRRWMLGPDFAPKSGTKVNADGQDERAIQIMHNPDNARISAARLVRVLGEHGIRRSRSWVWQNRCRES